MHSTLISVIIPVYNGESLVAEAISSVLAQTYQPVQVIVVDDGSTDATAARVRQFGERVQYHYQVNQGTGAARNTGIRHATGEYLAFLDQDDVWLQDKLSYQVSRLVQNPGLDAVFGWVEQFHDPPYADSVSTEQGEPIAGYLPSALLVKRASFDRVGPFETESTLVEWAEWYTRAVGLRMEMPPRVVARRRIHSANKGVLNRNARVEYAKMMRAFLERRRARE